ncbi:MAG: efflux RND transporter periplasmic adaptor subunit [Flavobacteriales bacterium]|nr:efflux RND transporter periplasmic adaptor subunit [Flavobacteriales bacterium]
MKKTKIKTKYIVAIAVVAFIILLAVLKSMGVFGKNDNAEAVTFDQPFKGSITQIVTASGKIQPKTEVKIAPEVSGEIIELTVKEGDEVNQGDLLVQIKPDIYVSALNRAKAAVNQSIASLEQSSARLKEAQSEYNRSKSLFESGTIAKSDWETTETNYKVAVLTHQASQSSLESARASLKEAEDNLTRTRIYAPITGTISKLNVEKGERVVGTATMAGTEVLRVANLDVMEVEVTVGETDIVKIAVNNPVSVEVDAFWGKKFRGVVEEIGSSADGTTTSADQVTNFAVKILLSEDSYKALAQEKNMLHTPFKPGMTAAVDIEATKKDSIMMVPIKAVTTRQIKDSLSGVNETKQIVFVEENGKAKQVIVETGIQNDENIEVISGLTYQDKVIVGPYAAVSKTLADGKAVNATKSKDKTDNKDKK